MTTLSRLIQGLDQEVLFLWAVDGVLAVLCVLLSVFLIVVY